MTGLFWLSRGGEREAVGKGKGDVKPVESV